MATGTTAKATNAEVWDIDQYSGEGLPEHWRAYPTGLSHAVSVLLPKPLVVQAMHDLGEDIGKAKAGTTIKGLLDEIMGPLLEAHSELSSALETIRHVLTSEGENRSEHLQQFDTDATAALAHFFPGLALDLDLQVVDVKEFFKAGDLHVTDKTTGDRRRFDQMGTGAQRAIQMALIRYLAETRRGDDNRPARRLLLIDEPELYLHPQGVRRLRQALGHLAEHGFQIIFSTHSRTLFKLGNLAETYFASSVVVCEGKTDGRLLPIAYEKLYGITPDIDHIAFVSVGGCGNIPKALPVMAAMGIAACAVVDLDFGYTHARSGGMLPRDGDDLTKIKAELVRLQSEHDFVLHDNGLPKNDKATGHLAADTWALFAASDEGKALAEQTQHDLQAHRVWAWCEGCIEQVTGTDDKGEDAIIEQEQRLRSMSAAELEQQMPAFKACFDWIRSF